MGGVALEQEVRFCSTPHGRVAYASVGSGPVLLMPGLWISHVELEWGGPELRSFFSGLAREHRVVRYDRPGTGLSDRDVHPTGLDAQVEVLESVVDELGVDAVSLFGFSWGGCTAVAYGARHPDRVRRAVLYGTYAHGADIAPAPLLQALVDTIRAHWGAGSRALADVWLPGASPAIRRRFTELQREAVTGEVAADALEAVYATDVADLAPQMRAPTLVLHRRRDRAIPYEQGRELAALLPDAHFETLSGDTHPPWLGDASSVVRAVNAFLGVQDEPPAASPVAADDPLTDREREVLALVASGLTNEQIAAELVLSPHTVHRHVANVRLKLGQPSRAAAAAFAARHGLI